LLLQDERQLAADVRARLLILRGGREAQPRPAAELPSQRARAMELVTGLPGPLRRQPIPFCHATTPGLFSQVDPGGCTLVDAALAAGFTELKLTGELSKIGMGGNWGTFINNKKITKCDLTGVTGWGTTPTLPELAFKNCTALQEVTLPDDVQVIGSSAFFGCAALTTVNLSQVTWINLNAFWGCTSLEMLILDNVTAIGRETFYGCTSLKTLKIPKCTRFGNYIVTGCKALTRIEATATGDFADLSGDDVGIERTAVFHNSDSHSGDSAFNPAKCDLVLNADKKQDGWNDQR
jgi:hypothetical protein